MIHRLRIKGYKSLHGADVTFAPLTVVFGPNAAGKSNLLDALTLLSAMVTRENLDTAFASHRGNPLEAFTFSEGGLKQLQNQPTAEFAFVADVELSEAVVNATEARIRQAREGLPGTTNPRRYIFERRLRYTVKVQILTESGHLQVIHEKLEALKDDWTPKESRRPFLETVRNPPRIHLRMEKQGHPIYEDIGQDRTVASKPLYLPHYPHIAAFKAELSDWRFYFLEPSAMRRETPLKEVDHLAPDGSDLAAFYNTIKANNVLQLQALSKTLSKVIPTIDGIDIERTLQGLVRLEVDERGIRLPATLISEGTLRVLGLLAITNSVGKLSLVGYEEPENGVHSARLTLVSRLLTTAAERRHTQFIINTHSPILTELLMDAPAARVMSCYRDGRESRFRPVTSGTLFAHAEIREAFASEDGSRFRDRVVRGEFG